jgi:hypothetical protein
MIRSDFRKPPSPAPAAWSAEDRSADFGALVHLGLWGGIAAACLLVVAIAARTETGQSRLAAVYSSLTGAPVEDRQNAERNRRIEEARRTAETIRNLTQDRDRLLARMTALERNYEDVTGSIGKLANAARPPAEPAAAPPVAPTPDAGTPAASAPVASAPASTPAAAAAAPAVPEPQEPVSSKAAFGVDIGGGPTLASLRAAWDRIRRNHARLLEGLQPVIAVRDGRSGQIELRLVAGPIDNAAAAARLCASLAAAGLSCQPTAYDGQRMALR